MIAQAHGPWWASTTAIVIGVLILLLAIVLVVLLVRRNRKKKAAKQESKPEWKSIDDLSDQEEDDEPAIERMKDSFELAVKRLRSYVSGRDFQYGIPWYLLLGEEGSGKSTVLSRVGMNLPLAGPPERRRSDVEWWFFEDGIVLDVPGEFVLARQQRDTRDRLWRSLLRLLQRHRRLRPIDGLIVTIPASDLVGPERPSAEKLERKADQIFQKLLEAQRMLGFRFPIYVLITKCDGVAGFQSYVHEVPVALREGMLGWSSPYGLETAYSPAHVDEAFDELSVDIHRSQIELMQDSLRTSDPDGFFLFPRLLERLREPLKVYLNEVMKESAYHEAFFLRGIYFTGDSGEEEVEQPIFTFESGDGATPPVVAEPTGNGTEAARARPVFLTDLFSKKIFSEFELAQPLSQIYFWRNRTARIYQIAALALFVIWGSGMTFSYHRLDKTRDVLEPALDHIRTDVIALEDRTVDVADDVFIEHAEHLVDGFVEISSRHFNSVFIPALWFSDIDERIDRAFAIGFDKIVFKAIRLKLDERATTAINTSYYESAPSSMPLVLPQQAYFGEDLLAVDEYGAFRELSHFVEALEGLEIQGHYYNQLPISRRSADLMSVLEYLFSGRIPDEEGMLIGSTMEQIRLEPFKPEAFRVPADARARVMLAQLYVELFRDNPLLFRVKDVALKLDALTSLDRRIGTVGGSDVSLAGETVEAVARLEYALRSPALSYVHMRIDTSAVATQDSELVIDPALDRMFAAMDTSAFFGPELMESARRTAASGLAQTRQELLAINAAATGSILEVNAVGELVLSPYVIAVRDALMSLGARHLATGQYSIPTTIDTGRNLTWDIGLLRQASELPQQFRQFLQDRLAGVPPSLRAALEHGTSGQLAESIIGLVSRAAIFESEPAATTLSGGRQHLQPQVENFVAAVPLLREAERALSETGAGEVATALSRLTSMQASYLLGSVDAILEEEHFYMLSANQIARWRDGAPIYATVFNTPDEKIIDVYLQMQWEGVSYLASSLAAPVLEALSAGSYRENAMAGGLVARWSGIMRQVQNKANKVPGNSVDILDGSVRDVLLAQTPEACLAETSDPIVRGDLGDYFLLQAAAFRQELGARCEQKALDNAVQRYERLAEFFNTNLGGRFPFADGAYTPGSIEASAADVRRFYELFDPFASISAPVLQKAFSRGEIEGLALRFVDQIKSARPLFAAYIDQGDTSFALPVVDFTVDFRVNRSKENLAEHIIEWSVSTAGKKVRMGDVDRSLRWMYGEPLEVDLRLARNSPYTPVGAPGIAGLVDPAEKRVTMIYDNNWALPNLLARQRVPADGFADGYDTRPHTLLVQVQLQRENAPQEEPRLEAFFRTELVQPKTGARFALGNLPRRAPTLRTGTP